MFEGLEPPTLKTFVAQVRMRLRSSLRHALSFSHDKRDMQRAYFQLGIAEGQVRALYDANADDAYWARRLLNHVQRRVASRFATIDA